MDIGKFLRSGETTLYTKTAAKVLNKVGPLVLSLTLGALAGCSSLASPPAASAFDLTGQSATHAQAFTSSGSQYAMDGPTLMYQAMVDPTMKKITAASSTSQFLSNYLVAQPESVVIKRGDPARAIPPLAFQMILDPAQHDGISAALENIGNGPSACLILSRGIDTGYSDQDLQGQAVVSYTGAINIASLSRSLAYIAIHESAHCLPFTMMKEPDHSETLELSYYSSVGELRSDLAVVLFSASKLGTFDDGLAAVGALRGQFGRDTTHSDFEMLKLVVKGLDAEQFYGKPLHELSAFADKALAQMKPATNQSMREAFAREAWTNTTLSDYRAEGSIRPAPADYARFAGKPFTVDLEAHAKEVVDLSLDNALRSPGAVRLSRKINAHIVQAYSELLGGGDLTPDQIAKADFLDGNRTPVNAMRSADGKVSVLPTTLDMSVLLHSIQPAVEAMAKNGIIQTPSEHQAVASATVSQTPLSARLNSGLKAMEKSAEARADAAATSKASTGWAPKM